MVITTNKIHGNLPQQIARAYIFLAFVTAFPSHATASNWAFIPSIHIREGYSDNVQLAPPPQARSDFVSEVTPSISITGNDANVKIDISYSLQKLFYLHRPDSLYHELTATINAELLDEWLFLDVYTSNSRKNISAFGPQAFDSLQQTANQSNVRTIHISPFIHHHFHSFATSELRLAHDTVSSSDNLLDVSSNKIAFTLKGDNFGSNWSWDAYYNAEKIDDTRVNKGNGYSEAFSLRHNASEQLAFFATSGHEHKSYVANLGAQPQGHFYFMGANWTSNRSSLSLSAGRRFFGRTYNINASRRSHNAIWSLNYGEDITTTAAEFLRLSQNDAANLLSELWSANIPNPVLRKQVVTAFLNASQLLGPDRGSINYFSHNYFLQKQLSLSVAAMSAKSTLLMVISATRRSEQTNNTVDSKLIPFSQQLFDSSTAQAGVSAGWNWRMSTRTSVNVNALYDQITTGTHERRDDDFAISLGLSRVFLPKIIGSFNLRHVRHNSTQSGASYRENGVSAALNFQL